MRWAIAAATIAVMLWAGLYLSGRALLVHGSEPLLPEDPAPSSGQSDVDHLISMLRAPPRPDHLDCTYFTGVGTVTVAVPYGSGSIGHHIACPRWRLL